MALTPWDSIARSFGFVGSYTIITRDRDANYPSRLIRANDRMNQSAAGGQGHLPPVLYVRGSLTDAEHAIAIVGARRAQKRDLEQAHGLARDLAERGHTIISGGALGVDSAAHRGALAGATQHTGCPTVVVTGCGIDIDYPSRNRQLYRDICARGGAIVSQFPPGSPPKGWHFVQRNATIAGLADLVIVISANKGSGSMHTARAASRYGRILCAVPGSPGCDFLLANGAAMVNGVQDLLSALAGVPCKPKITLPTKGSLEERILSHIDGFRACDHEEIAILTGVGIRDVIRALTDLEVNGLVTRMPGQTFTRSRLAEELLTQ